MNAEPKWPTVNNHPITDYDHGYNHAIEACRAAWLVAADDPSASPVGEVRRAPTGESVVRVPTQTTVPGVTLWVRVVDRKTPSMPWGYMDEAVKGWPVIGAVPGSPAEAKS